MTIEGPDGTEEHKNMKLVQITKVSTKEYWFIIADKTAEEVAKEATDARMTEMEQAMKVLLTGEE